MGQSQSHSTDARASAAAAASSPVWHVPGGALVPTRLRPPPALETALIDEPRAHPLQPLSALQAEDLRLALAQLDEALAVALPATTPDTAADVDSTATAAAAAAAGAAAAAPCSPHSAPSTQVLGDDAAAAAALLLLKPYEELYLSGYELGDAALTSTNGPALSSFLSVVSRHVRLRVLDLSFNALTPQVIAPLLDAIGELPLLTELKLSGNPLGSAQDAAEPTALAAAAECGAALAADATAAERLGRWLASNPPLQDLALVHCDLADADVRALLAGLAHPLNTTLQTLRLAWNPRCTSRSTQMALQLVTDLGNTTLLAVQLEGAPPATRVRLEYACTAEGVFRSGRTLTSADADADVGASAAAEHGGDTPPSSPPTTPIAAVSLQQLREQKTQLADIRARLAPGPAARYDGRCRYLVHELDGQRVLTPLTTRELATVLSTRTRLAPSPPPSPPPATTQQQQQQQQQQCPSVVEPIVELGCSSSSNGGTPDASSPAAAVSSPTTAVAAPPAADTAATGDAHVARVAPLEAQRPRTCPPMHLRGPRHASVVGRRSLTRSAASHRRSTQAYRQRTPQEMRDSRFESPLRLAEVMADAEAFGRRLHSAQVDTRAPPCAEASRHGSRTTTWYAADGFTLRSNGLTRVLVAPVLPGGAAAYHNVPLEDVQSRSLLPCWCTPRQTSAMTGIFAGTLHYHCVHEATAQQHKSQYGAAKARLPSLQPQPTTTATAASGDATAAAKIYHGCQGTGHLCLSAGVATDEAAAGSRRARLRATLRAQACKSDPGLSGTNASPAAAAAARAPDRTRAHFLDWTTSSGNGGGADEDAAASPTGMRVRTVHTTSGGVSVALNYSPVSHFSAAHVGCATGMALAEF